MSKPVTVYSKRVLDKQSKSMSEPAAKKLKPDRNLSQMMRCCVQLERLPQAIALQGFVTLPKNYNEKNSFFVKQQRLPESSNFKVNVMPLPDSIPLESPSQPKSLLDQSLASVPKNLVVEHPLKTNMRLAILQAASIGDLTCLEKYLLKSDIFNYQKGVTNGRGETPLIIASVNGHMDVVRFLVEAAEVDLNEYGNIWSAGGRLIIGTALHAAVVVGKLHAISYLSEAGQQFGQSTVNEKTRDGLTSLHLAAIYLTGEVQRNVVYRLLFYGADFTLNDSAGKKCWELTPGLNFLMLMVQYWDKFGVTGKTQQIRNKIEIFYRRAKSIINLEH